MLVGTRRGTKEQGIIIFNCSECTCTKWGEKCWFKRQLLRGIRADFFLFIFLITVWNIEYITRF